MHVRLLAISAAVLIGGCAVSSPNAPTMNESALTRYGIGSGELTPADLIAVAQFGPTYAAALHDAADSRPVADVVGLTPEQVGMTGMPADITAGDWRLLQIVAWRVQHGLPANTPDVSVDLHPGKRTDAGTSASIKSATWQFPFGVDTVNEAARNGPLPPSIRVFQTVFPRLKT